MFQLRLCHTGAKNRQRKVVMKFVIRCVCQTEGLKSWQIMKKMTHKNLNIVKKLVIVPENENDSYIHISNELLTEHKMHEIKSLFTIR